MYAKTFLILAMAAFVFCAPVEEAESESKSEAKHEATGESTAASTAANSEVSKASSPDIENVKELKPKDEDTVVSGAAESHSSTVEVVNGKVVKNESKDDEVVNKNGKVTEHHSETN